VADAVAHLDAEIDRIPITPERLLDSIAGRTAATA
jgi:hypothetical protein